MGWLWGPEATYSIVTIHISIPLWDDCELLSIIARLRNRYFNSTMGWLWGRSFNPQLEALQFQFHYGMIVRRQYPTAKGVATKFQFHYGMIVRAMPFLKMSGNAHFNSTMGWLWAFASLTTSTRRCNFNSTMGWLWETNAQRPIDIRGISIPLWDDCES